MGLPKRDGVNGRYYLIHKPEVAPEVLEVCYYGNLLTVKGEPNPYIVDGDGAPGLVAALDPENGEEFVIFDAGRHGYNNLFCDEHDPAELEHTLSSGMRSPPPSWFWSWATASTMTTRKRTLR